MAVLRTRFKSGGEAILVDRQIFGELKSLDMVSPSWMDDVYPNALKSLDHSKLFDIEVEKRILCAPGGNAWGGVKAT